MPEALAWTGIFTYAIQDTYEIRIGMPAVYWVGKQVIDHCHTSRNIDRITKKHRSCMALADEMTVGASFGAELHSAAVQRNLRVMMNMIEAYKVPYLSDAERTAKAILLQITRMRASVEMVEFQEDLGEMDDIPITDMEYDMDMPEFNQERSKFCGMTVRLFPRCVVLKGVKTSYVLGLSDWRKVVILVTGFRNYIVGCCADASTGSISKVAAASRTVSAVYISFREAVSAGADLEVGEHLHMAKAYKTMLAVVKAGIAGRRAVVHATELTRDMRVNPVYIKIRVPLEKALGMCISLYSFSFYY